MKHLHYLAAHFDSHFPFNLLTCLDFANCCNNQFNLLLLPQFFAYAQQVHACRLLCEGYLYPSWGARSLRFLSSYFFDLTDVFISIIFQLFELLQLC